MKTGFIFYFIICLVVVLGLSSCSKDEPLPSGTVTVDNVIALDEPGVCFYDEGRLININTDFTENDIKDALMNKRWEIESYIFYDNNHISVLNQHPIDRSIKGDVYGDHIFYDLGLHSPYKFISETRYLPLYSIGNGEWLLPSPEADPHFDKRYEHCYYSVQGRQFSMGGEYLHIFNVVALDKNRMIVDSADPYGMCPSGFNSSTSKVRTMWIASSSSEQ